MAQGAALERTFHSVVMVGLAPTIHDFFGGMLRW
jgi:hypothetical protein